MNQKNSNVVRVLITSGGTSEKIDQVRKLTNMSTGRLGNLTAQAFSERGAQVTYVYGRGARHPSVTQVEQLIEVESVTDLERTLQSLLKERQFDCIVHAMAVSDYTLQTTMTEDSLTDLIMSVVEKQSTLIINPHNPGQNANPEIRAEINTNVNKRDAIKQILIQALNETNHGEEQKKITSSYNHLFLAMKKTPKVIDIFKSIQPGAKLFGFKLLVGVSKEQLIEAAQIQMRMSGCDFVVANDLEDINEQNHQAMILDKNGAKGYFHTKTEIANSIADIFYNERKVSE